MLFLLDLMGSLLEPNKSHSLFVCLFVCFLRVHLFLCLFLLYFFLYLLFHCCFFIFLHVSPHMSCCTLSFNNTTTTKSYISICSFRVTFILMVRPKEILDQLVQELYCVMGARCFLSATIHVVKYIFLQNVAN